MHLKMLPHHSWPHFTDDPSTQLTLLDSGTRSISIVTALLFHGAQGAAQDSLNRSQHGPGSPHTRSVPESPFPSPIVLIKDLLGPKTVLDAEARGKHTSPYPRVLEMANRSTENAKEGKTGSCVQFHLWEWEQQKPPRAQIFKCYPEGRQV